VQPSFGRSEGSRAQYIESPREIPRPAGENAGLRDDAFGWLFPFREAFPLFSLISLAFDFSFLSNQNIRRHSRDFRGCCLLSFGACVLGWGMKKRKARIIQDKKARGEWAESIFLARAAEHDLPVSKPWGDSESFDCVVGRPGKFVAVQVKSTVAELEGGKGYICSVCSSNRPYPAGAFDFLAAYVVPEEVWYLIPAKGIVGMKSLSLCTRGGKYEPYREAWHLLREAAAGSGDAETGAEVAG